MNQLSIRTATLADADACNDFHNSYYSDNRTSTQWRWEFAIAPNRLGELPFVVAEEGGRIVGTQAIIPVRLVDADGSYLTGKSEETLVASEMRGRNLFGLMYQRLFRIANDRQMRYVWGFTPADGAFKKLGFQVPATTGQLFHPISPDVVLAFSGRQPGALGRAGCSAMGWAAATVGELSRTLLTHSAATHLGSPLELTTLDGFPHDIGALTQLFVRQWGGTTILRDKSFLDWRLAHNPYLRAVCLGAGWRGRLVGYCALALSGDRMGQIVDILAADPSFDQQLASKVLTGLLRAATLRLRDMGALGVRMWTVNKHPFDRIIGRAAHTSGFWTLRRGHSVVVHSTFTDLENRRNLVFDDWYVTRLYTEGRLG